MKKQEPGNFSYNIFTCLQGTAYDIVKLSQGGEIDSVYRYEGGKCDCPDYQCRVSVGSKKNCKHERILLFYQKELEVYKHRSDWNKTVITGYIANDPVLRETRNGKKVANFTVAVNEFVGMGENQEPKKMVTFISCTSWNDKAENICRYAKKGTRILVEGSIRQNRYENRDRMYLLVSEGNSFEILDNGVRP